MELLGQSTEVRLFDGGGEYVIEMRRGDEWVPNDGTYFMLNGAVVKRVTYEVLRPCKPIRLAKADTSEARAIWADAAEAARRVGLTTNWSYTAPRSRKRCMNCDGNNVNAPCTCAE